ncbi:MAG: RidA family protein [Bacteroidia bacterium]|nr:RidA family protein [Bacteroidia bacterium]
MDRKIILSDKAPAPIGPYSQAVMHDGRLFCSGQIALDPVTGLMVQDSIEAETKQVMENIGAVLIEAGMDYSHIIKTSIFITDMNNFAKVNTVYAGYFKGNYPARETVQVSALPKNGNVEITVIAGE